METDSPEIDLTTNPIDQLKEIKSQEGLRKSSIKNRVSVNSLLQNTCVYVMAYAISHHYTLLAVFAFATTRGVTNLYHLMLPTSIVTFFIAFGHCVYHLIAFDKSLTRYPILCSMSATQISCLAFVYVFGYFTPTLHIIM